MKYFKEIDILKQLGKEGLLTEQEVLAGIDLFDPTLGSFNDKQGAMLWLKDQKIIGHNEENQLFNSDDAENKSVSKSDASFISTPIDAAKLDWRVTPDDVYLFNSKQAAALLNKGVITEQQYKKALEALKGYFYAFCWEEALIRWIRSDYRASSIFDAPFDVNDIDTQTALQLFALYKNEVINIEEYLESYQMLTSEESESSGSPRTFSDAIECFKWLVENEALYHSFDDISQAINYTRNISLLDKLETQGLISSQRGFQIENKIDESPNLYFKDEYALLEWVKQEGLFVSPDVVVQQQRNTKKTGNWIFRVVQILIICLFAWLIWK